MDPFTYVQINTFLMWSSLFLELYLISIQWGRLLKPINLVTRLHNWMFFISCPITLLQCTAATDPTFCTILSYSNVLSYVFQMWLSTVYIIYILWNYSLQTSTGISEQKKWFYVLLLSSPMLLAGFRVYNIVLFLPTPENIAENLKVFNVCDFTLSQTGALISNVIWISYTVIFLVYLGYLSIFRPQIYQNVTKGSATSKVLSRFNWLFRYRILLILLVSVFKTIVDFSLRKYPSIRLLLINVFIYLDFLLLNVETLFLHASKEAAGIGATSKRASDSKRATGIKASANY
ncbi:hypothetical protein BC833DRAFT_610108 [Globomyces pollinis-pini]|nr:hypothetical protein BC833DRAFT_610108 [Globomyces pollinis-pini]